MSFLKSVPFGSVVLLGAAGLSLAYLGHDTLASMAAWTFYVVSFYPLIFLGD